MIDFREELAKFKPASEVDGESFGENISDLADILFEMAKAIKEE